MTEWLSLLAKDEGGNYNKASIDSAWQTVLRNQFHDIILGSSIHEVYEDSTKEYDAANTLLDNLIDDAAKTVSQDDQNSIMLVNPCPVSGVHCLPVKTDANVSFADEQGNLLCSQKTADGYVVAVDMQALSVQNIKMTTAQKQGSDEFIYDGSTVKSRYYDITLDETGCINAIYDKENSRDVLSGKGNLFEIYEDMPDKFDAWNIEMYYMQKAPQRAILQKCYLKEQGKIRLVICSEYVYNKSVICQDMVLYSDSRRIDFVTHVDWHESHRLLKAAFDVDVRSIVANYDIQFGHAPRPTHYNTSWDYARFEALGHKWVDLSDDSYGAAILNDCKYGHSVYQNRMTITLLKASKEPDYDADMGEHSFTYSFLPHSGSLTHSEVVKESWLLNVNPSVFVGKKANCTSTSPLVTVEKGNVLIDAVKQADDDNAVVVRMHEYCGGKTNVVLNFSKKIKSFSVCNLLEQNQGDEQSNENISFSLNLFELRTYKIYFE